MNTSLLSPLTLERSQDHESVESERRFPTIIRPPPQTYKFTKENNFKSLPLYEYEFELEKGKECLQPLETYPTKLVPVFLGYCYFCDCPKHSQNYCPLRYCHFCDSYGHSTRVCPKNSAHGNDNWRRTSRHSTHANYKYWKKPHFKPDVRIPFGSTWKSHKTHQSSLAKDWRKGLDTPSKPVPFDFGTCTTNASCGLVF